MDGVAMAGHMGAAAPHDYGEDARRHETLKEMRSFIRENNVMNLVTFQDWCDVHNDFWSRALDEWAGAVIEKYIDDKNARNKCRTWK